MRHARLTWKGAYHHIMNRGIREENIFLTRKLKEFYITGGMPLAVNIHKQ